ncbi:MAG: 50S ribosomal protein L11 methyltransferase, partial [Alphaproteobacteria bacterium]|nr:50S ribosomal protein L11 methyltransferase [Alphaproteobacteria bacterium]
GGRLLEIGTGAGLLALLGAEAGFAEVITCEADPLIAAAAREVVAANGLSDRITVIAKRSTELQVGVDLPGPADALVTETFGSALLSEGVLPSLDHARRVLLAPDALIVPRAGSIMAALVGGDSLARQFAVGRVMGFDLSPFERFRMVKVTGNLDLYGESELLSEPAEMFGFDFQNTAWHPPATRALTLTATRSGLCQGVAQWIRLDLDDQATYENRPGQTGKDSGWTHYLHFFPRPRRIEAGEVIRLDAEHDRLSVDIVEAAP